MLCQLHQCCISDFDCKHNVNRNGIVICDNGIAPNRPICHSKTVDSLRGMTNPFLPCQEEDSPHLVVEGGCINAIVDGEI